MSVTEPFMRGAVAPFPSDGGGGGGGCEEGVTCLP